MASGVANGPISVRTPSAKGSTTGSALYPCCAPTGFTVSCFPVKIERASAGWTRAVAIIDG